MKPCPSCHAYGGTPHSQSCATRTGKRIITQVQTAGEYAQQREMAKRTAGWMWEPGQP